MRLAVRCDPEVGTEGLAGYVVRLARINGYEKVDWLLQAASLSRAFASVPSNLGPLADLTGASIEDLRRIAAWPAAGRVGHVVFGDNIVHASHLDFTTLRFCPACLETDGRFRCIWLLRACVACEIHGVLLMDKCRQCGRRHGWRDAFPEACACGTRVRASDAAPADAPALRLAKLFQRLASDGSVSEGVAPFTTLNAALDLAWFFATSGDHDEVHWRSRHMSKPGVAEIAGMAGRAWRVLSDWPQGLHAWLQACHRKGEGKVGLIAEFGPWLRRLSAVLADDEGGAVATEVRSWLVATWGRGTLKPSSFFYSSPSATGPMTAVEAARMLGVSGAAITVMLASGDLSGERLLMGERMASRIDRDSVNEVMTAAGATCSVDEVAAELGLSANWVRTLRRKGLLASKVVLLDGRRVHRFRLEATTAFVARLSEAVSPRSPDRQEALYLTAVTARRQVRLDAVLEGILAGQVQCWLDLEAPERPALGRFLVRLPQAAAQVGTAAALSVREAASRLRVSIRMVPILMAAGCLEPALARVSDASPNKRNVLPASVEAFGGRFMLSRDIARRWGTSCKAVVAEMALRGIAPVVAANSNRGISAVWRMTDADHASTAEPRRGR